MDFDELLQRDIDDFRVATGIIPYLSDPAHASQVRFLPPILVAVLPFADGKVLSSMPEKQSDNENVDRWGEVVKLERLGAQGSPLYRLFYNSERSRLVVLDGQHRAMAVLAIKREKQNSWGDNAYRRFYEEVGQGLADISDTTLRNIQLPVCILVIDNPDRTIDLTSACRGLFLDVNKQAKPPTTARMRLLDDVDLRSIFARRALSEMRSTSAAPNQQTAVHFFEYDNPKNTPKPTREIAYSSVEILWSMIRWSMFEADEYHVDLRKKAGPARPGKNFDRVVKLLGLDDEFTVTELGEDGFASVIDLVRSEKTLDRSIIKRLSDRFATSIGAEIVSMFGMLHPFAAHAQAVVKLKREKAAEREGIGAIAFGALFDGAGTYWTLRDFHTTRAQQRNDGADLPMLDVENAYTLIHDNWLPAVERSRAAYLVNKEANDLKEEESSDSAKAYEVFRTQAFQVGVFMAFTYLAKKLRSWEDSKSWLQLWNEGLVKQRDGYSRALWAYSSDYTEPQDAGRSGPVGYMGVSSSRLQASDWFWFRYLSLEQMLAVAGRDRTEYQAIREGAEAGRKELLKLFRKNVLKDAKSEGETLVEEAIRQRVVDRAVRAVGKPYGICSEELARMYGTACAQVEDDDANDEDQGVDREPDELSPAEEDS